MIDWKWHVRRVSAADILTSAKTLPVQSYRHEIVVTPDFRPSAEYLRWAREALQMKAPFGLDAALCYAKRAVCREIDAFVIRNHFKRYLQNRSYPKKIELLT